MCFKMPHESAEPDEAKVQDDEERPIQFRTRSRSMQAESTGHQAPVSGRQTKALSLVAETPTRITHHHDDDDDDDKTSTA